MKRFFSFLAFAVLLTSCDDGDLQEVSFEFNDTPASACNSNLTPNPTNTFFLYKTTDQRALILKLAEGNFTKNVTTDSVGLQNPGVIKLTIGTNSQLSYRVYNDDVSTASLCPTSGVPSSYPFVEEERNATGGNVLIRTTTVKTEEDTNGATKITNYLHTITFSDFTFDIGDANQRNESLPTITYLTRADDFFAFDGVTADVKKCTNTGTQFLYKRNGNQALSLRLSEEDAAFLFSNDFTAPKVRFLNEQNILTHQFFSRTDITPLTDNYFCITPAPDLPISRNNWAGQSSTNDQNGIIEVVTEQTDDNEFKHTITLKNVTMFKKSQNFKLKRNYNFGTLKTTTTP